MSDRVGIALVDEHPNGYRAHVKSYLESLGFRDFEIWAFRTYGEFLAALHWGDLDVKARYFFIGKDADQIKFYTADREQASSDGCPERIALGNFLSLMYNRDSILFLGDCMCEENHGFRVARGHNLFDRMKELLKK